MSTEKKYRVGNQVVFTFNGVTRLGKVEGYERNKKALRYIVRCEAGNLYPGLPVDQKRGPGQIRSKITEAKFGKEDNVESAAEFAKHLVSHDLDNQPLDRDCQDDGSMYAED